MINILCLILMMNWTLDISGFLLLAWRVDLLLTWISRRIKVNKNDHVLWVFLSYIIKHLVKTQSTYCIQTPHHIKSHKSHIHSVTHNSKHCKERKRSASPVSKCTNAPVQGYLYMYPISKHNICSFFINTASFFLLPALFNLHFNAHIWIRILISAWHVGFM